MQGRLIAGRYRLVSLLGRGGMGAVWRAEHVELGTPAAVKLLDPRLADSADALRRFKREARAAAELRSAHIVQIFDYGVDQGDPYIAMELYQGETLGQRLDRAGRLDPKTTARLLSDVGKAVSRAHEAGIVHRDLTPDNVFLVREGTEDIVRVLDFGIAKDLSFRGRLLSPQTRTGTLLGTPHYMSPEQASGKKSVGPATDIWALSVMAFECIVGRRPFDAETVGALILAICKAPIPVPSQCADVPNGFDEWFHRGTRRDPEERFPSVKLAMAALRAVCGLKVREDDAPGTVSDPELDADGEPTVLAPRSSVPEPEAEQTIRDGRADIPVGSRLSDVTAPQVRAQEESTMNRRSWRVPLVASVLALALIAGVGSAWLLRAKLSRPAPNADSSLLLARKAAARERKVAVLGGSAHVREPGVALLGGVAAGREPAPAGEGPVTVGGSVTPQETSPGGAEDRATVPTPSPLPAVQPKAVARARRASKPIGKSAAVETSAPEASNAGQPEPPIPEREIDRVNPFGPVRRSLDESNPFGR